MGGSRPTLENSNDFFIFLLSLPLPAGQKTKMRWFVYLMEDTACMLQYVGSTTDACSLWSRTKSACNRDDSVCTGMYRHFMMKEEKRTN